MSYLNKTGNTDDVVVLRGSYINPSDGDRIIIFADGKDKSQNVLSSNTFFEVYSCF